MDNKYNLFQAPPEVMKWFKNLTDKQLVEFFYQAVQGRRNVSGNSEVYNQEHFVLALASRTRDVIYSDDFIYDPFTEVEEFGPWEPWKIRVLALHSREKYSDGWADEAPICQAGTCVCGHATLCYAKYGECPVCGEICWGT
jgi:hypothetical protein